MFIKQINDLKEKEENILWQIEGFEISIKEQRENLNVIRRGLKSMQRLQDQLCAPSDETHDEENVPVENAPLQMAV